MLLLFITVIISPTLAQVFVSPGDVVSVLGGSATFFCSTSPLSIDVVTSAQWLLNDTLLEDSDIDNVQTSAGTIQLRFSPVSLEYNTTRIRCRGTLTSGNIITSNEVMLLIQGHLSAVGSLSITASNSILSLNWEPPFSLGITNVDPDIAGYCVDVINSTSSVTLHSECNITEPSFSYPIPPDADCHRYNFTVRGVNAIGMGEPATATFRAVETSPHVLDALRVPTIDHAVFVYILNMSAPVCSSEVTLLSNLDTGEMLSLSSTDTTIHDNNSTIAITFNRSQVTDNHHYSLTVVAANSAGENSSRIVISTHDIINVFIDASDTEVITKTVYFEDSNATGALYEFIFISDSGAVDFTRSVLVPLDRETSDYYELPFSLSSGLYKVFVYDIEDNGILSSGVGYPALMDEVDLAGGTEQGLMPAFQQLEGCTINVSMYLITAECTYPCNSMATGFLMIVQLGDPDLVHKLYVNQTTDQQGSVTVEVEEEGTYLVSIIPILADMGVINSSVEYTTVLNVEGITTISITEVTTANEPQAPRDSTSLAIAGVLPAIVLYLITVGIILPLIFFRKRKSMNNQSRALQTHQSSYMAWDIKEAALDEATLPPLYSSVDKIEVANGNQSSQSLQTLQGNGATQDNKEAVTDDETVLPLYSIVNKREIADGNQPSQPLQTLQGNEATQDNQEVPDGETLLPLYSIVNKREIANESQSYCHDDTIVETRKVESTVEFADADEIPPPLPPPCKDTDMLVAPSTDSNVKSTGTIREVPKAVIRVMESTDGDKVPPLYEDVLVHVAPSTDYSGAGATGQIPIKEKAGTVGDHYAEIHPSLPPNEGMLIRDAELVYSTPVGYKTKNNQNYAFVQVPSANSSANVHEVSRDVLDGIIYSDIKPHKESASSDRDLYLEQIPQQSRWKLDKELDWDNDFDRDLTEIAQCIVNWQGTLKVHLGLTETDVDRINQETTPTLRQSRVLRIWKEKQKYNATYINLLKCVVAGKDHKTAKKICGLEVFQGRPLRQGGGTRVYQQPTGNGGSTSAQQ